MADDVLARLMAYAQPQENGPTLPLEMFMRGLNWNMPIPEFQINSNEPGLPRFSGRIEAPALGGSVGLSGDYQARQFAPPDWGAMLRYRREF